MEERENGETAKESTVGRPQETRTEAIGPKSGLLSRLGALLKEEGIKVLEAFVTAKNIVIVVLVWLVLSILGSVYIALNDKCDEPPLKAGDYFEFRLLCPVKK